MTKRESYSTTEREEYDLVSHFDEGSCDEEEEEHPISEKEYEEEVNDLEYKYAIPMNPHTYPEVRSKNSSPSCFVNKGNNNSGNRRQGDPTSQTFNTSVPRENIMAKNDIKLSIFNGNRLEDTEQH